MCSNRPGAKSVKGFNVIRSLNRGFCRFRWAHPWEKSIRWPWICMSSVQTLSQLLRIASKATLLVRLQSGSLLKNPG